MWIMWVCKQHSIEISLGNINCPKVSLHVSNVFCDIAKLEMI